MTEHLLAQLVAQILVLLGYVLGSRFRLPIELFSTILTAKLDVEARRHLRLLLHPLVRKYSNFCVDVVQSQLCAPKLSKLSN